MSDIQDDLRATAESIAADAEQLAAIETKKSKLDADDPRMIELSRESSGSHSVTLATYSA